MHNIKVALDAMGGDEAPEQIVKGAVLAAKDPEREFDILLCGPQKVVEAELKKNDYSGDAITVVDAPDLVAMDESPTKVLKEKQKSGIVTCVALQKQGLAQASVSAGNSGAMMASCLMVLGRAANISRPAIACAVPTAKRQAILLDCGANVDEKPSTLVDFALCGSVYAEAVMGYKNPTVGLVNMGEEEKKGTEVLQETHKLLKQAPLNFIGNIEGRDLIMGHADVAVAPGYAGNVILKIMEGFYELAHEVFGEVNTEKSKEFNRLWDYRNHGGGLLLGLNGVGIVTHGRADSIAIRHSLFTAYRFAKAGVPAKLQTKLSEIKESTGS
ncbi:MAG: phosphate acyltransferase PlsX [Fibromonadales bacterium]|nr:phosphate acyltransferase PlsX [Fibromonadales bacterium]